LTIVVQILIFEDHETDHSTNRVVCSCFERVMPQTHTTDYASPVLRTSSPASSLNACPDQTSLSDNEEELPQPAFERKWEERLGIGLPRPEELYANGNPLLPQVNGPVEEQGEYYLLSPVIS
jgi:hypothetical protein